MISMTWPQYLRREVRVTASLSRQEAEFLSTLLVRHPLPVPVDVLIEALWPACEPKWPETKLSVIALRVRRKIGQWVAKDWRGYRLCH